MYDVASDRLDLLHWRSIGPHRGGRTVAVAGHPTDPMTFYFGACAGGVWKTTDGGTYWKNVSDGYLTSAAVGAIAIAQADPNILYIGMGEACLREDVYGGDGVYKSTDSGRTWLHLGLEDTQHISRIRVHPTDPNTVYVAALGHAFGPNTQRGVFRSQDGGLTWEHILFRSENAGATDLSLDINNPRTLFAAIYQTQRYPWTLEGGGPESGLYRSTDAGTTWKEITGHSGLPRGPVGRIGIAISPAQTGRVFAMVEAKDGGVFRSDDNGDTWEHVNGDAALRGRPWYYTHIFADPQDPDTVWVLEGNTHKSTDGGRTFSPVPVPHGDCHDLWIDPKQPQRVIHGNDGGACVSFNGGSSWSTLDNQPTAQFYHITTDNQFPYRVYGSQQDNTSITLPSRSNNSSIGMTDWYVIGGGESGYIAVHPINSNIVYAGNHSNGYISRYDHHTGQTRNIMVWPEPIAGWGAKDMKYRFQWTFPILLSPHDPETLYVTGNHVFQSKDEGGSWEIISPDLTRNDLTKMEPSGGPISKDVTNAEYYGTIFSFAESPIVPGLLWAGSDDGLVHVSEDGGKTWSNRTPEAIPEWALISTIEVSRHDPKTAFLAATRAKLDDRNPYLFRTTDLGLTWKLITSGIADTNFTRVVREDPIRPGLLYAGTDVGVHISFNHGEHWQSLQANLPVVPIHDLHVKDDDLIVATHGRGFWIIDDVSLLRQLPDLREQDTLHLFTPRNTVRIVNRGRREGNAAGTQYGMSGPLVVAFENSRTPQGLPVRSYLDAGANPTDGVLVRYLLPTGHTSPVTLTFKDAAGKTIRSFSAFSKEGDSLSAKPGMNELRWDLRYPGAKRILGDVATEQIFAGSLLGPLVLPGRYEVTLETDSCSARQEFEVLLDPRLDTTPQQLESLLALQLAIRDKLSDTHEGIERIQKLRAQIEDWIQRSRTSSGGVDIGNTGQTIVDKLVAIDSQLRQINLKAQIDRLKYPVKLNGKLAGLSITVGSSENEPTRQMRDVHEHVALQVDQQLGLLDEVIEQDVPLFTNLIQEFGIPMISP